MMQDARMAGIARHLDLALRLAGTSEGLSAQQIAEEMGVGIRTAQRMRASLHGIFDVRETGHDGQTKYRIEGGLGQLAGPKAAELAEFSLAIDHLRGTGNNVRADHLASLLRKIRAAMREGARLRLDPDLEALADRQLPIRAAGPQLNTPEEVLAACQTALMADAVLSFDYRSASGALERREVAPRGLLLGPRSYLVGALNGWGDPALWRLDRMSNARVTERPAWPDEGFDLARYAARSFGTFQEPPEDVVLRFDAEVAEGAAAFQFHPDQTSTRLPGGELEVRFTAGGLLELAWHLFTWSGAVEILSPLRLREIMAEELEKSAARLRS